MVNGALLAPSLPGRESMRHPKKNRDFQQKYRDFQQKNRDFGQKYRDFCWKLRIENGGRYIN
jgi:hypothetical protein